MGRHSRYPCAYTAWLILQGIAIQRSGYLNWQTGALVTIASLLTAWVLIRLASMPLNNSSVSRVIAISAWSVAALKGNSIN